MPWREMGSLSTQPTHFGNLFHLSLNFSTSDHRSSCIKRTLSTDMSRYQTPVKRFGLPASTTFRSLRIAAAPARPAPNIANVAGSGVGIARTR